MAKRSNTSAHNRSHQQHRNGIKKPGKVDLWFTKGMNSKFLRNLKAVKLGIEKKKKADAKAAKGGKGSKK
jgi:large subunit ribosomal protein L29e